MSMEDYLLTDPRSPVLDSKYSDEELEEMREAEGEWKFETSREYKLNQTNKEDNE